MNEQSAYLTPPKVAVLLRVKPDKVLYWIHTGQLQAINVSDAPRPRFRISQDALDTFLKRREVQSEPRIKRRRQAPKGERPSEGGPIDPDMGKRLAKTGKARLCSDGKWRRVWNGITWYV